MDNNWYFDALPCRPQPYAGECLSGYLLRLAAANGYASGKDFLFRLFPGWRYCSQIRILRWEYPVDDWGLLPQYTRLPPTELQKLTLLPWVAKFRSPAIRTYLDRTGPGSFLRDLVEPGLRVCPLCLQEQPYIRLMWRLAPVQACLRHGCQLPGRCHVCCQPLTAIGWQHRHLRCGECGADLRDLPVTAASDSVLAKEARQQQDFQFLLDPDVTLVNGTEREDTPSLEPLPQAIGFKLRYLRCQAGYSLQQMDTFLGAARDKASRVERGDRVPLPLYLTYLENLSYSWSEFAAVVVPPDFAGGYTQPAHMAIRLCPNPGCPNHKPPTSLEVRLLRDNVKSQTVGLHCLACGQRFIRRYTGELVPAKIRRSPIPSGSRRQLTKPAEEVALLKELGLQGETNQEIARRLGWQMQTVRWYLYALGLAEGVCQAQKQCQQQKREQQRADLRARVEAVLSVLRQQDEDITLTRVSCALGYAAAYLSYYDDIVQRVREVAEVHNNQCRQRRTEALRARIEKIIAQLPNRKEGVTAGMIAGELDLTPAQLCRTYPELWTGVREAVQAHKDRLKELKRQRRCAHINEVAAGLLAQGRPLTIKGLLRETGVAPYVYQSDMVIRELIQWWVWDPASKV